MKKNFAILSAKIRNKLLVFLLMLVGIQYECIHATDDVNQLFEMTGIRVILSTTQPVGFHPLAYLEGNSHAENFPFLKEIPREEKQEAVYGIEHKFSIGTIVVLGESDKYYKVLFMLHYFTNDSTIKLTSESKYGNPTEWGTWESEIYNRFYTKANWFNLIEKDQESIECLFELMWKFDFKSKSGRNALQLLFPTTIYNRIKL